MNPLHIVYGVIGLLIVGYVWKCESTKTAQAAAVVLAEQARDRALKKAEDDRKAKENADAENKVVMAELTARIKRMRATSGVGRVPPAPPASRRPDLFSVERAEYQRAYGTLVAGLRELADEGTATTVDLNSAKQWSSSVLLQHQPE